MIEFAGLFEEALVEAFVFGGKLIEDFTDVAAGDFDEVDALCEGAEDGGDADFDGHEISKQLRWGNVSACRDEGGTGSWARHFFAAGTHVLQVEGNSLFDQFSEARFAFGNGNAARQVRNICAVRLLFLFDDD
jgi:hypothetical protein